MINKQGVRLIESFLSQRLTAAQLLRIKGGDNDPVPYPNPDDQTPGPQIPRPK